MSAHGTRSRYVTGCRCDECRRANREYASKLTRANWSTTRIDPQEVRAHVDWLRANGMGLRSIAVAADVTRSQLQALQRSRKTNKPAQYISWETARRILAVSYETPAQMIVGGLGAQRRLRALVACGWSLNELDRRLGMADGYTSQIVRRGTVRQATVEKIAALYDELWDVPPPAETQAQRAARRRSLNYARKHCFVPPMAWDDDTIDDPEAQPSGYVMASTKQRRSLDDIVEDFNDTRDHHQGNTLLAAERLGMSEDWLVTQLRRAQGLGHEVDFISPAQRLRGEV